MLMLHTKERAGIYKEAVTQDWGAHFSKGGAGYRDNTMHASAQAIYFISLITVRC